MIVLIKKVQVCGIRQAMQFVYSGKREVSIHPLTSTDFHVSSALDLGTPNQFHKSTPLLTMPDNGTEVDEIFRT